MNNKKFWKKYLSESEETPKSEDEYVYIRSINKFALFKSVFCIVAIIIAGIFLLVGYLPEKELWEMRVILPMLGILLIEFLYARPLFALVDLDDDIGIAAILGFALLIILTPITLTILIIIQIKKIIDQFRWIKIEKDSNSD